MASALDVLHRVADLLDASGIRFVVVGSFASSARGHARATADIDFVADVPESSVPALVAALTPEFYVDETAVRRAVRDRRSFNAIHLDSMLKIDVFVAPPSGFRRAQLEHGLPEVLDPATNRSVPIATAEDTILSKLLWYRDGGEVSDRQWSDVLGVIRVQGAALDLQYLRATARELDVGGLFDRALAEAGSS